MHWRLQLAGVSVRRMGDLSPRWRGGLFGPSRAASSRRGGGALLHWRLQLAGVPVRLLSVGSWSECFPWCCCLHLCAGGVVVAVSTCRAAVQETALSPVRFLLAVGGVAFSLGAHDVLGPLQGKAIARAAALAMDLSALRICREREKYAYALSGLCHSTAQVRCRPLVLSVLIFPRKCFSHRRN